jgi:hypothetical protein
MYKDIQDILKWNGVKTYRETRGGLIAIHKRRIGQWFYFVCDPNTGRWSYSGSQEHFTHEDGTREK